MGLFTRADDGPARHAAVPEAAEASGIAGYDPELVGRLKGEHLELLGLFTTLKHSADGQQFQHLPKLLYKLEVMFQKHVTLENAKLYAYVEQQYAADQVTARFVATVRTEMDDIAYTMDRFVNTHLADLPTAATATRFGRELERIHRLLTWRLQFEERSLFSFYQRG